MTVAIMTIDKWLPKKEADSKKSSPLKRLIMVSSAFTISILVLNLFHVFGMKILINTNGYKNVTDVLKVLLP